MEKIDFSELSDQELLELKKKTKRSSTTHAFMIGFLGGIILYSIGTQSWGWLTLIPVYLIYLFTRNSDQRKALKAVLTQRNL